MNIYENTLALINICVNGNHGHISSFTTSCCITVDSRKHWAIVLSAVTALTVVTKEVLKAACPASDDGYGEGRGTGEGEHHHRLTLQTLRGK